MVRGVMVVGMILTFFGMCSESCAQDSKKTFKVGDVTIEVDSAVAKYWTFSNFKFADKDGDVFVQGIAVYLGGKPAGKESAAWRFHCYDGKGVNIYKGDPDNEEFTKGEKTRIEVFLGEKAGELKKIKVKLRD